MRVLFQTRPDHDERPGGDRVVIDALRERLRALGLEIDLSGATAPELRGYDAVHLFNLELMPHTSLQAENARRHGRPYFVTPTYWTPGEASPRRVRVPGLTRGRQRTRKAVLAGATRVFASCEAERRRLLRDFSGLAEEQVVVARFGYRAPPPEEPTVPLPEPGYILCVGGFGHRKNQLNLARALREVPRARIVFVGSARRGDGRYRRAALAHAPRGSLSVLDQPHGALPFFYERARVVVQPSFVELPGLVAMEAVANLRPVVTAGHEPAREYLEGLVTFADPASPESIRRACLSAAEPDPARVARFVAEHDWTRVVKPVEDAYQALAAK